MTTTPSSGPSFPIAGIVAVVAGVTGIALLVLGVVRLVGSIDTASSETAAFVTTTSTQPAPTTTEPVVTTTITEGTTAETTVVADFMTVTDDSGTLSVTMPASWTDVSGSGWTDGGETVGVSLGAAVDRDAWYEGWGTPGAFIGISTVSPDAFTPELVDFSGACTLADTGAREYEGYTTVVEEWVDCGDAGSDFTTALLWPSDFAWSGLVQIVTLDGSSSALLDRMITTLSYTP